MRRYDRRLRRLAQQVKESLPARRQARLQRMSHNDLMTEEEWERIVGRDPLNAGRHYS